MYHLNIAFVENMWIYSDSSKPSLRADTLPLIPVAYQVEMKETYENLYLYFEQNWLKQI